MITQVFGLYLQNFSQMNRLILLSFWPTFWNNYRNGFVGESGFWNGNISYHNKFKVSKLFLYKILYVYIIFLNLLQSQVIEENWSHWRRQGRLLLLMELGEVWVMFYRWVFAPSNNRNNSSVKQHWLTFHAYVDNIPLHWN